MVSPEVGIREGIRDKDSGVVGRRAGGEVVLASKRARRAKFKYSFPQQSASSCLFSLATSQRPSHPP